MVMLFVRPRVVPATMAVVWIALGLALRRGSGGHEMAWVVKYGGVVLWCWVVHACVRMVKPEMGVVRAALWTLAIGVAVEVLQLSGVPRWLSGQHWALRLVFGEVFSVWDVVAGVAAAVMIVPVDWAVRRLGRG